MLQYRKALAIAKENFGETPHPITAEALYGIGLGLGREKDAVGGLQMLEASLRQREVMFPAGHPDLERTKAAITSLKGR